MPTYGTIFLPLNYKPKLFRDIFYLKCFVRFCSFIAFDHNITTVVITYFCIQLSLVLSVGVTACFPVLGAYICGKPAVALYDGSWTEYFLKGNDDNKILPGEK